MSNTVNSANMSLPIPVVGVDPGPNWATDVNSCLTILDAHDHTPGNGVPITPSGININIDLSLESNNLVSARSVRLNVHSSPLALATDLNCAYDVLGDLYFNDGSGNQIRITQGGALAGTPGSIANLVSPASATYVAGTQTFVWQSDANVAAFLDAASIILRNTTVSSNGLTLSPPTLASNYTITLPQLPGSIKFLSIDSSGNMYAVWAVDGSTLEIASNVLRVKAQGITASQILNNTITASQIAAATITSTELAANSVTNTQLAANSVSTNNIQTNAVTNTQLAADSVSSTNIQANAVTTGTINNLAVTLAKMDTANNFATAPVTSTTLSTSYSTVLQQAITLHGRPCFVSVQATSGTVGFIGTNDNSINAQFQLLRGATEIGVWKIGQSTGIQFIDFGGVSGSVTYKINMKSIDGATTAEITNMRLVVYEI